MQDNTCVCCGSIIPEGRYICLHCGDYDDQQRLKPDALPIVRTNGDRIRQMNNSDIAHTIGLLMRLDCITETALYAWLETEFLKDKRG